VSPHLNMKNSLEKLPQTKREGNHIFRGQHPRPIKFREQILYWHIWDRNKGNDKGKKNPKAQEKGGGSRKNGSFWLARKKSLKPKKKEKKKKKKKKNRQKETKGNPQTPQKKKKKEKTDRTKSRAQKIQTGGTKKYSTLR